MSRDTNAIAEGHDRLYAELPDKIVLPDGALNPSNSARPAVVKFLNTKLQSADKKEIESELKKTFPLHKQKAGKIKKAPPRKSSTYLTARERRDLGLSLLPKTGMKYRSFDGLHVLWQGYIRELLDLNNGRTLRTDDEQVQMRICRADYHGALMKVTRAANPNLVGIQGYVVMESRNTLQIITVEDVLKIIPKRKTTFSFQINGYLFSVSGSIMCCKPSERAVKKWKNKWPLDI